jgi:transcription elongation factor SPT5
MSSADLLNNDFGSESEDDNDFNPAPADVSDRDDAEENSEDDRFTRDPKGDVKLRRRDTNEVNTNGAEVNRQHGERNGKDRADADEDAEGDNEDEQGTADGEGDEDGGGDDDDDDDDEEDEDDDDEEAMVSCVFL